MTNLRNGFAALILIPIILVGGALGWWGVSKLKPHAAPAPTAVAHEAPLSAAQHHQLSVVSASVKAATTANASNPDGNPKTAVNGELGVAADNLPEADPADQSAADARVIAALNGHLADAKKGWDQAKIDAGELKLQVKQLQDQVAEEKKKAASEIDRLKAEADGRQRNLVTLICSCIGGLFLTASIAAGIFLLWSGVGLTNPKGLYACGLGLLAAGLCFAIGQLFTHPWVQYVVGGIIALCVIVGVILFAKSHWDLAKAKTWAEDGLSRAGDFMRELKTSDLAADVKAKVTQLMDSVTDKSHQEAIAAVAHTPPPVTAPTS